MSFETKKVKKEALLSDQESENKQRVNESQVQINKEVQSVEYPKCVICLSSPYPLTHTFCSCINWYCLPCVKKLTIRFTMFDMFFPTAESQIKCPTCRQTTTFEICKDRNTLSHFRYKCKQTNTSNEQECNFQGTHDEIVKHQCPYELIKCLKCPKWKGMRQDVKAHDDNQCMNKVLTCTKCGEDFLRKDRDIHRCVEYPCFNAPMCEKMNFLKNLTNHQQHHCKYYQCPNHIYCSTGYMTFHEWKSHTSACLLHICPYVIEGCLFACSKRSELKSHICNSFVNHQKLVSLSTLTTETDELTKNLIYQIAFSTIKSQTCKYKDWGCTYKADTIDLLKKHELEDVDNHRNLYLSFCKNQVSCREMKESKPPILAKTRISQLLESSPNVKWMETPKQYTSNPPFSSSWSGKSIFYFSNPYLSKKNFGQCSFALQSIFYKQAAAQNFINSFSSVSSSSFFFPSSSSL
jgi:hypothetical protein